MAKNNEVLGETNDAEKVVVAHEDVEETVNTASHNLTTDHDGTSKVTHHSASTLSMVDVARECVTAWVKRWVGVPDPTQIQVLFVQELTLTTNINGARQQINVQEPICRYENITIVPHVDTPLTLITAIIGRNGDEAQRLKDWYDAAIQSARESSRSGVDQLFDMVEPMLPKYDRDGNKVPFDFTSLMVLAPQLLDHNHPVRAALSGQRVSFKPGYVIDPRKVYFDGVDSVTRSKIASETSVSIGQLNPKELLSHPKLVRSLTTLMANVRNRDRRRDHGNDGPRDYEANGLRNNTDRGSFW